MKLIDKMGRMAEVTITTGSTDITDTMLDIKGTPLTDNDSTLIDCLFGLEETYYATKDRLNLTMDINWIDSDGGNYIVNLIDIYGNQADIACKHRINGTLASEINNTKYQYMYLSSYLTREVIKPIRYDIDSGRYKVNSLRRVFEHLVNITTDNPDFDFEWTNIQEKGPLTTAYEAINI